MVADDDTVTVDRIPRRLRRLIAEDAGTSLPLNLCVNKWAKSRKLRLEARRKRNQELLEKLHQFRFSEQTVKDHLEKLGKDKNLGTSMVGKWKKLATRSRVRNASGKKCKGAVQVSYVV